MLIAVPLGVGLAIGLTRWRGYGARPVNYLMLFPLVTPEIVMAVSLLLVFVHLYDVPLGTEAQTLGQVTFSISYVVIIVRGRLLSIGPEYEEAARDLGASQLGAFRLVLFPLLAPGDLRQLHRGLRALDRRLRRHRLPFGGLIDADRPDPHLLDRARHRDAGAQRRRDGDGGRRRSAPSALAYSVYRWAARSQPSRPTAP